MARPRVAGRHNADNGSSESVALSLVVRHNEPGSTLQPAHPQHHGQRRGSTVRCDGQTLKIVSDLGRTEMVAWQDIGEHGKR